ncbi:MAG TPA: hypothetical protein VK130_04540, partial [Steroidobacteraceae bacterium]|nr:hypothetical protein [Steroidobacteraceae bacterium]
ISRCQWAGGTMKLFEIRMLLGAIWIVFALPATAVNGYQDPRIDGGEVVTTMHGRVEGCL